MNKTKLIKRTQVFKVGGQILFAKGGVRFDDINQMYAQQAKESGKEWTKDDMRKLRLQWDQGDKEGFIGLYNSWRTPKLDVPEDVQASLNKAAMPDLRTEAERQTDAIMQTPKENFTRDFKYEVDQDYFSPELANSPEEQRRRKFETLTRSIVGDNYNKDTWGEPARSTTEDALNNISKDGVYNWNQVEGYGTLLKRKSNKYYDSLIQNANKRYGSTVFNNMEDVAAFQKLAGLKVDGIIGPQTMAALDTRMEGFNNDIDIYGNHQFYRNSTNDQVRNQTLNRMIHGEDSDADLDFSLYLPLNTKDGITNGLKRMRNYPRLFNLQQESTTPSLLPKQQPQYSFSIFGNQPQYSFSTFKNS